VSSVTLEGALPDLATLVPPGEGERGRVTVRWTYAGNATGFRIYLVDCDGTVRRAAEAGASEHSFGPLQPCRPSGNVGVAAVSLGSESTIVWAR
jgi:hypothetical protein